MKKHNKLSRILYQTVLRSYVDLMPSSEFSKSSSFDIDVDDKVVTSPSGHVAEEDIDEELKKLRETFKAYTLGVTYAANTGGTATLMGTTPNMIMKGYADEYALIVELYFTFSFLTRTQYIYKHAYTHAYTYIHTYTYAQAWK